MTLGERIFDYRARHGLSQVEFAKLCKCTSQTISNIENGYQNASRITTAKIELVLNEKGE